MIWGSPHFRKHSNVMIYHFQHSLWDPFGIANVQTHRGHDYQPPKGRGKTMILLFREENEPEIYNVGVGPAPVMAKLVYNPHEYYSDII